jgi:hypothetical protein
LTMVFALTTAALLPSLRDTVVQDQPVTVTV